MARTPLMIDVRLDPHLGEPADDPGRAPRVEGAEQEMSGEGGLEGDLGGRQVADLAHPDHLGVLPHHRAEADRQVEPGRLVDLGLGHARDEHLDRVFQGHQATAPARGGRELAQAGVEGRGLAAAGGPGEQDRAGGLVQELG